MKPNRIITANIHDYEDMSLDQINALIDGLCDLRKNKLTKITEEYAKKMYTLACEIMDDGFVIYCGGKQIEPSDLDVRID